MQWKNGCILYALMCIECTYHEYISKIYIPKLAWNVKNEKHQMWRIGTKKKSEGKKWCCRHEGLYRSGWSEKVVKIFALECVCCRLLCFFFSLVVVEPDDIFICRWPRSVDNVFTILFFVFVSIGEMFLAYRCSIHISTAWSMLNRVFHCWYCFFLFNELPFIHTHSHVYTYSLSFSSFTWHGCLSNNAKCKHFEICRFAEVWSCSVSLALRFHSYASLCLARDPNVCIINVSLSTPPVNYCMFV